MMDVNKICEQLDSKIPREAVSQRSAGGAQKLSYLETWYVIDRLNKVFGNLGWNSETVENVNVGTYVSNRGDALPVYRAKVRITVYLPDGTTRFREGTGWGCDKSAQNPHEMAAKESESDALKRAAMKFGMSMGLALYDKSQENVDDGEAAEIKPQARAGNTGRTGGNKPASVPDNSGATDGGQADAAGIGVRTSKSTTGTETRQELIDLIGSSARVLVGKRKFTADELQAAVTKDYGVPKADRLTVQVASLDETQLRAFMAFLDKHVYESEA
jgi:DNA recombination protein Rad52